MGERCPPQCEEMAQHRKPSWLASKLQSHSPQPLTLLTELQATLPSLCWNPRWVAAHKVVCIVPFRGCLHFQQPLTDKQQSCCFSQRDIVRAPFSVLVLWDGEPNLGFRPQGSQWERTTISEISLWNFSCCLWEPVQPFCISALGIILYAVFTFHPCYQGCLQLVFSWFFKMAFLYFSCMSSLAWESVSLVSTYFTTIFESETHWKCFEVINIFSIQSFTILTCVFA